MTTNNTCRHESHDQESNKVVGDCNSENPSKTMASPKRKQSNDIEAAFQERPPSKLIKSMPSRERNQSNDTEAALQERAPVEDTGRERLKKHRIEVAGRVWIPEIWGQEDLLKDWVDCCAFDASWMNTNIILARTALVEHGRRPHSTRLR